MKPDSHSELRQEEIRDILGVVPPWILRWGMLVLFLVFTLLVLGTIWLQYPDRITSQIAITTLNPPVEINARKEGRIQSLQVVDGQEIKNGQLLAVLESTAHYEDMFILDSALLTYRARIAGDWNLDSLGFEMRALQLGEWQSGFARFQKARQDLVDFLEQDSYQLKIKSSRRQLSSYQVLIDRQSKQQAIRHDELAIEESQYNRIRNLYENEVVSTSDHESAKAKYLQARYALESANTALAQSQIEIDQIKNQVIDLENEYEELKAQKINLLSESLETMIGMVQEWKLNYALISPVNGMISLTRFWFENQTVKPGDRIVTILTGDPSPIIGRVQLPIRGAGKVEAGQKVLVRIDRYPYMEYGMLMGKVSAVSKIADEEFYSVEVDFPDGLNTTYGKPLDLSQGMTGSAEIITAEMSLLVRIINPIKNLIYRNRI
jgi:HlyD family secretion protein